MGGADLCQYSGIFAPNGTKMPDFFKGQFSVHFGLPSQNVMKTDFQANSHIICPIQCQFDPILGQLEHPYFAPRIQGYFKVSLSDLDTGTGMGGIDGYKFVLKTK